MSAVETTDEQTVTEAVDHGLTVQLRRLTRRVTTSDGVTLVVVEKSPVDAEEGRRVVLVHGLRGTRAAFDLSTRSFQNFLVHKGCRTFCADLRGSGLSREAGSPAPTAIRELVDLDLPALVDAAGPPVTLVGHSLGALAVCLAAARLGDAVDAVVAIAPPHSPGAGQPIVQRASRAWVGLWGTRAGRRALESRAVDRTLVLGRRFLDHWPLPPLSRSVWPGSMEKELQAELETISLGEPAFPGLLMDLSRMSAGLEPAGLAVDATLAELRAPVLAIVGDRDEIVAPVAVLPLADAVPRSRCEVHVVGTETVHLGHGDVILGRRAPDLVWEAVWAWMEHNGMAFGARTREHEE